MIIKGGSCAGSSRLAAHLLRADHNERVQIVELRGSVYAKAPPDMSTAADLRGALADMEALAAGLACKRPLYHASLNTCADPDERLTAAQRAMAIDRLEAALGLAGQPRAVVLHLKDGREHTHIVWARADAARGRIISDSFNFRTHEAVARALEQEFSHAPVRGAHVGRQRDKRGRRPRRPERSPGHAEQQQGARSGIAPDQATAQITALWRGTATGQEFAAALEEAGWRLCRGDRRDFVLLDPAGNVHSLARRVQGARAADIRARMKDVDPMMLPAVSEARSAMRAASAIRLRQGFGATRTAAAEVTRLPRPRMRRPERGQISRQAGDPPSPGLRRDEGSGGQQDAEHADRRGGQGGGLYVTVSRQRLDYSRAVMSSAANSNSPIAWTPARIKGLGAFVAASRLMTVPDSANAVRMPIRPARAAVEQGDAATGSEGVDVELAGMLEAIADEVQRRIGVVCDGIAAEFALRIRVARKTMPRDQIAAAVLALRQAKKVAVRLVREAAAVEIAGRQKQARVMWRRRRIKSADRTIGREHLDF